MVIIVNSPWPRGSFNMRPNDAGGRTIYIEINLHSRRLKPSSRQNQPNPCCKTAILLFYFALWQKNLLKKSFLYWFYPFQIWKNSANSWLNIGTLLKTTLFDFGGCQFRRFFHSVCEREFKASKRGSYGPFKSKAGTSVFGHGQKNLNTTSNFSVFFCIICTISCQKVWKYVSSSDLLHFYSFGTYIKRNLAAKDFLSYTFGQKSHFASPHLLKYILPRNLQSSGRRAHSGKW